MELKLLLIVCATWQLLVKFSSASRCEFHSVFPRSFHNCTDNRALNCILFMFYLHIYGNWNAMLCIQNKCKSLQKMRAKKGISSKARIVQFHRATFNLTLFCWSLCIDELYGNLIRRRRCKKGSALKNRCPLTILNLRIMPGDNGLRSWGCRYTSCSWSFKY